MCSEDDGGAVATCADTGAGSKTTASYRSMLQRTTWSQVWRHALQYLNMDGSPPPEVGAPPVVLRSYRGDELPADVQRSLRMPIEVGYLFRETAIPLHPGAEAFALEHGYFKRQDAAAG